MKIVNVVGARPNLMKIAPLLWEMRKATEMEPVLVHTGQHYDHALNDVFFRQLDIQEPDHHLGVGSGSHGYQTAQVILKLEGLLTDLRPDLVVVVGDVNSTLAAALTAAKLRIPVAHVEAGLRSFDRTMPEELNRIVTDSISNFLFITEPSGVENLRKEGLGRFLNQGEPLAEISADILAAVGVCRNDSLRLGALVGNVMIDTLYKFKERAEEEAQIRIPEQDYALLTLHRPGNVDDPKKLRRLVETLHQVSGEIPIFFPCHPRTRKKIEEFQLQGFFFGHQAFSSQTAKRGIHLLEPLGYLDFLKLMANARLVLTDSGGIQEETTILGVPCLTLRENTERPSTITNGTNVLVGSDPGKIFACVLEVLRNGWKKGLKPALWDGRAATRIVQIIKAAANVG
jgi:UDP-N-acetylglucosamine 2-epimerase (non-hydrolysing)